MRAKAIVGIVVVLVAAGAAWAAKPVSETVAAAAIGEVSIEVISGDIEISGWDRDEVEVTGTIGDDVERLQIESEDGEVRIELEIPEHEGRRMDVDANLVLHVPRGASVEVATVSAEISIEGTSGEVSAESVSGGIEIGGAVREVEAATVSGDIEIRSAEALAEGDFESVSGNIDLTSALGPSAELSFESVSGDIALNLPADTSAQFEVETFSGKIENDFGPQATQDSPHVPAKSLSFATGTGGARVEIESFSGRIELRNRSER